MVVCGCVYMYNLMTHLQRAHGLPQLFWTLKYTYHLDAQVLCNYVEETNIFIPGC